MGAYDGSTVPHGGVRPIRERCYINNVDEKINPSFIHGWAASKNLDEVLDLHTWALNLIGALTGKAEFLLKLSSKEPLVVNE